MVAEQWNNQSPIYKQLKAKVMGMLLDGSLPDGAALPSVRQLAADYQLNPITVSRAYQELADEGLIEKRRGIGMFVCENAPEQARVRGREKFMHTTWPQTLEKAVRLGISPDVLIEIIRKELCE